MNVSLADAVITQSSIDDLKPITAGAALWAAHVSIIRTMHDLENPFGLPAQEKLDNARRELAVAAAMIKILVGL